METTIQIFQRRRYANGGLSATDKGTGTANRDNANSGNLTDRTANNQKRCIVHCSIKLDISNESDMARNIESIVKDWSTLMRYAYGYTATKIKTAVFSGITRDGEEYLTALICARVTSIHPSGLTAETLAKDIADLKNRLDIITENTLTVEDVEMDDSTPKKMDPMRILQWRKRKYAQQ